MWYDNDISVSFKDKITSLLWYWNPGPAVVPARVGLEPGRDRAGFRAGLYDRRVELDPPESHFFKKMGFPSHRGILNTGLSRTPQQKLSGRAKPPAARHLSGGAGPTRIPDLIVGCFLSTSFGFSNKVAWWLDGCFCPTGPALTNEITIQLFRVTIQNCLVETWTWNHLMYHLFCCPDVINKPIHHFTLLKNFADFYHLL